MIKKNRYRTVDRTKEISGNSLSNNCLERKNNALKIKKFNEGKIINNEIISEALVSNYGNIRPTIRTLNHSEASDYSDFSDDLKEVVSKPVIKITKNLK